MPAQAAFCRVAIPVSALLLDRTGVGHFYPGWKVNVVLDHLSDALGHFSNEHGVDPDHSLLTALSAACFAEDEKLRGCFLVFEDPHHPDIELTSKVLLAHLLALFVAVQAVLTDDLPPPAGAADSSAASLGAASPDASPFVSVVAQLTTLTQHMTDIMHRTAASQQALALQFQQAPLAAAQAQSTPMPPAARAGSSVGSKKV